MGLSGAQSARALLNCGAWRCVGEHHAPFCYLQGSEKKRLSVDSEISSRQFIEQLHNYKPGGGVTWWDVDSHPNTKPAASKSFKARSHPLGTANPPMPVAVWPAPQLEITNNAVTLSVVELQPHARSALGPNLHGRREGPPRSREGDQTRHNVDH